MTHHQPPGFLAVPPANSGPGVLVLHAWWGLNDTIRSFCAQLAQSGFVVFAPDLYHGKVADTIADAQVLAEALDANHLQVKAEIADAVTFLQERAEQTDRGLAVIGFSLGAYYALHLSTADPEHTGSVVVFYGTGADEFGNARAAYLGHFAEYDEFEPSANVDALEEALKGAGRNVTFHRYCGTGHWFFEPDRPQAYNPEAAALAWDRTLAFLNDTISLGQVRTTQDRGTPEPDREVTAEKVDAIISALGDWRGATLARVRALIRQADPDVVEELKWRKPSNPTGVPVWSHHGLICTGETYKDKVKLTFAQGASIDDPAGLFNAGLQGNTRRAIDIHEGDSIDESAFQNLVRAAVDFNSS